MSNQIDPKLLRLVSTTKRLLGKHISKPVLADKYLSRPPFRFLLEIVNNVIQQTGFLKDVFTQDELKYDEISSAEDKRAILKKVIEAIENETGEKCSARTSKILSGKEPEKTNEMLQLLAKALSNISNKPRIAQQQKKEDEPVAIPEEFSSTDPVSAGVKVENEETTQAKRGGEKNEDNGSTKMKMDRQKNKLLPATKKASNGNTLANAKTRSSGEKNVASKFNNSSAVSKISLKETVKSKAGSPSASSSALVIPLKKTSSSNLIKTISRQSLAKPSASANKVAISQQESVESIKASGRIEESGHASSKEFPAQQKSQGSTLNIPNIGAAAAMPPETSADVPTQRPVTRTKYRQKNNEGEIGDSEDLQEVSLTVPPITMEEESTPSSQAQKFSKEIKELQAVVSQETMAIRENEKKSFADVDTRESGRSTSSDDVVTEHMNQKISEWRASSAEPVQQVEMKLESASLCNKGSCKTGWITDSEDVSAPPPTKSTLNRVFESVEDCVNVKSTADPPSPVEQMVVSTPSSKAIQIVKEAPPPMIRPVTVLRDNESSDEDDDSFLIQEKIESERDLALERLSQGATLMAALGLSSSNSTSIDMTYLPPEQRGLLVNQIMETQRELEKLSSSSDNHQANIMMENELAERDKSAVREVYLRQIEDLKGAIQKMSKCANPLANIIQRSQDDACLMEMEFRKLRQENERLQNHINEAKGETSRILYPLTEELAQLDNRIDKVESAIILAKQRLSLIDNEYSRDFIAQIENTPTEDESITGGPLETDPIWLYRRGNFGHDIDDDDKDGDRIRNKSLMDLFRMAVNMHDQGSEEISQSLTERSTDKKYTKVSSSPSNKNLLGTQPPSLQRGERRLLNRTVFDHSPLERRSNRILRQLERHAVGEPPVVVDKENKPSWWD